MQANLLGCSLGLYVSRTLAIRRRHRRELAALYQPLDDLEASDSEPEANEHAEPEMAENPAERRSRQKENDVWDDGASDVFSIGDEEAEEDSRTPKPPVQKQAAVETGPNQV